MTVPLCPLGRSPVILVLANARAEATRPPGVSQYSAESGSTRSSARSGESLPSGNHASTIEFHSSSVLARSWTTVP